MGKLRTLSGREVCSLLAAHGFVQVWQRGSHVVIQHADASGTTTVPVPDHRELKAGTLRSIIRQSGLSRALFEHT